MGLISTALNSVSGVLADQWREYFYCESIDNDILVLKGQKRTGKRSSNTKGSDNLISNGSIIAVADGQCMMIVEQGKVVDICAEPGEFVYDTSSEPSLFYGNLSENIKNTFMTVGKRFTFGGDTAKDQRVYYFNTKHIMGNKYGTPSPVPFRVVDQRANIDIDVSIRCFGEYTYHIIDPLLFYKNVCSNVSSEFRRSEIDSTLKSDLLTALQPAFAKISEMGVRYSALPGHTVELANALNEVLSSNWRDRCGIEIVTFGVNSVKAIEEDEALLKELQRNATFTSPMHAAAHLVSAQGDAMKMAASNTGGAAMAFMGMNMANQMGGFQAQNLYQMGMQQPQQAAPMQQAAPQQAAAADGWDCSCGQKGNTGKFCAGCGAKKPEPKISPNAWKCSCGATATGKFCPECGSKKPEPASDGWTCSCGAVNKGKFCVECGAKKPAGIPQYRCDKCGWEPADKAHPPKFCPECGDPFDDGDLIG